MRRSSAGLMAGLLLLGSLWAAAFAAPLVAGDRPLLQRTAGRIYVPVLSDLPLIGGWFGGPAPDPAPGDLVLRPPLPYGPNQTDLSRTLRSPEIAHPLGTDALGRDVASRLLHGARFSLYVGGAGTLAALVLGLALGGAAGFRGGRVDEAISALIDVALSFPSLLLALTIVAVTDARGAWALIVVLGLTRWGRIARYSRAEFLRLRHSEIAGSARAAGAGELRVILGHLLPNALAPVLVTAAFSAAGAVLLEAALGFLGLGAPPSTPSWGAALADARVTGGRAWWLAVFPGAMIFLALLGYGLVGEGLLDRLDPRREAARSDGAPARSTAV